MISFNTQPPRLPVPIIAVRIGFSSALAGMDAADVAPAVVPRKTRRFTSSPSHAPQPLPPALQLGERKINGKTSCIQRSDAL